MKWWIRRGKTPDDEEDTWRKVAFLCVVYFLTMSFIILMLGGTP